MKPTTLIVIGVIVVALIGAYYFQVWNELNDFVDDVLFPDDEDESTYPDGWNVPGNVNYIVLIPEGSGYRLSFYDQSTSSVISFPAPRLSYMGGVINNTYWNEVNVPAQTGSYITLTQYQCGMSQYYALGGTKL